MSAFQGTAGELNDGGSPEYATTESGKLANSKIPSVKAFLAILEMTDCLARPREPKTDPRDWAFPEQRLRLFNSLNMVQNVLQRHRAITRLLLCAEFDSAFALAHVHYSN